ncbi:MAG: S-methyl-5'-thioadenosine phosphorylase [Deltaproteobacteria bacterium]|nr:S-methyl-5'-thioadenosine phosphorylase [Deltaproteobacteria bacterium]
MTTTSTRAQIGIIGGSGLYQMDGVEHLEEVWVDTPFGKPSDALLVGRLDGVPVAFLPRHGRGHLTAPHEINYRANIWALKSIGVRWALSVSAVGSMREEIAPGDLVVVDQFIDRTRTRPSTFFDEGVVAHVMFADPVCPVARDALIRSCKDLGIHHHDGGAYVCIEGPQFSTRAESNMYRSWGAAVIGMTNLPEAKLAREAEIAYATLAMATDYDCWHEHHDDVSVEAVLAVMRDNVDKARRILRRAVSLLGDAPPSPAWDALVNAIMTAPQLIPPEARRRLGLLIDHRLPESAR